MTKTATDPPQSVDPTSPTVDSAANALGVSVPTAPLQQPTGQTRPRSPARLNSAAPEHPHEGGAFGALLVIGGVAWLLTALHVVSFGWTTIGALMLAMAGLAVTALGATGHRSGPLQLLGTWLVVLLALAITVPAVNLTGGIGDRVERPVSVAMIEGPYELALGRLTLDLRELELPAGTTRIEATLGAGDLVVQLPPEVGVVVEADVGVGESLLLEEVRSGVGVSHRRVVEGSGSTIELALSVTTGTVEVTR